MHAFYAVICGQRVCIRKAQAGRKLLPSLYRFVNTCPVGRMRRFVVLLMVARKDENGEHRCNRYERKQPISNRPIKQSRHT